MASLSRRTILALAAGAVLAHGALAQQPSPSLIGVLHHGTKADSEWEFAALRAGMREAGFEEGRDVRIEYRFANYDYASLARLAEELVAARVQVIYAPTTWTVRAARSATNSVPIVFSGVNDPVPHKFVQSLGRPGGHITGISLASAELTGKRVQLMRELFPSARRLGIVYDKDAARECGIELREVRAAGSQLNVEIQALPYEASADLAEVFGEAKRADIGAMLVPTTYEMRRHGPALISQSGSRRLPLVHSSSQEVEEGGLVSYGPDRRWAAQRAGNYIGRILGGTSPAELPVERPTRYELVVNLKTARAMGVTIPRTILMRADRVIE